MKKILIVLTATLLFTLTVDGQSLFFIGENSYPCTETMTLKSNSDDASDLNILLAKDGNTGLFAVSAESYFGAIFSNKIIIYLQDGTVIKCNDRGTYDYVDNRAKAVYILTSEQLNKMKNSNIHTVRYTLEATSDEDSLLDLEWNWSASNKGIPTKTIITEFLENKIKDTVEYRGDTARARQQMIEKERIRREADERERRRSDISNRTLNNLSNSGVNSSYTEGISYDLAGRQARVLPKPTYNIQSEGIVVVEITVDRNGNVTKAVAGVKGSTTLAEYFLKVAREAALAAKFDRNPDAPIIQKGTVTYHFILR